MESFDRVGMRISHDARAHSNPDIFNMPGPTGIKPVITQE